MEKLKQLMPLSVAIIAIGVLTYGIYCLVSYQITTQIRIQALESAAQNNLQSWANLEKLLNQSAQK